MGAEIFQIITFTIQSILFLTLFKRCAKSTRLHGLFLYFFSFVNSLLSLGLIKLLAEKSSIAYICITVVVFFECLFLFRDKFRAYLGLTFGMVLHLFTIRAIVIAINSLVIGESMYEITHTPELLYLNTMYCIWAHNVILVLFIAFVPPKAVKSIIDNNILLNSICLLMGLYTLFNYYNVQIFKVQEDITALAYQQIIMPLSLLITFYVMLIFMIKLVMTDKYQKVIAELEKKIDKDQMLSNALFNFADIVVELNCTQNQVKRVMINSVEVNEELEIGFTEFVRQKLCPIVHSDDIPVLDKLTNNSIIKAYENGKKEISFDYRSYKISLDTNTNTAVFDESSYLWYRMRINSRLDRHTKDLVSVCTVDEINEEKISELALLSKTERDTLTGAFNKETIKSKVNEHLANGGSGTLFVFDIDNFKGINDNFGHSFGDEVLIEIYNKLSNFFRAHDYIGRFGGDEFVAFIHNETTDDEIAKIATRVCKAIEKTYEGKNGVTVPISSSIGISSSPKNATTYDELFITADLALYNAKECGKNTFTIYNKSII